MLNEFAADLVRRPDAALDHRHLTPGAGELAGSSGPGEPAAGDHDGSVSFQPADAEAEQQMPGDAGIQPRAGEQRAPFRGAEATGDRYRAVQAHDAMPAWARQRRRKP